MKYALSVVTGGLLLAVSAIAMAGALDGPLTDQQGLAREQARDQARSVAVERTQSVVADETANVAATEAMPAPVATQPSASGSAISRPASSCKVGRSAGSGGVWYQYAPISSSGSGSHSICAWHNWRCAGTTAQRY